MLREMYQFVLNEAIRGEELVTWLNGPRLVEEWRHLYLPSGVRQAWEEMHNEILSPAEPAQTVA